VALGLVFLRVLRFSPVSVIPPVRHTHSFIYHRRCIMFFSHYSSFPCQYHSTSAPHSPSVEQCSYQEDKRAKRTNLPSSSALYVTGSTWQNTVRTCTLCSRFISRSPYQLCSSFLPPVQYSTDWQHFRVQTVAYSGARGAGSC
jgi:hypothetical protein